jgi:hypothetical protein
MNIIDDFGTTEDRQCIGTVANKVVTIHQGETQTLDIAGDRSHGLLDCWKYYPCRATLRHGLY